MWNQGLVGKFKSWRLGIVLEISTGYLEGIDTVVCKIFKCRPFQR